MTPSLLTGAGRDWLPDRSSEHLRGQSGHRWLIPDFVKTFGYLRKQPGHSAGGTVPPETRWAVYLYTDLRRSRLPWRTWFPQLLPGVRGNVNELAFWVFGGRLGPCGQRRPLSSASISTQSTANLGSRATPGSPVISCFSSGAARNHSRGTRLRHSQDWAGRCSTSCSEPFGRLLAVFPSFPPLCSF